MSPTSDDDESVQFSMLSGGKDGSEDTSPPLKPAAGTGAMGNGDINALLKMPAHLVDQDLIKQLNTLIVAKALTNMSDEEYKKREKRILDKGFGVSPPEKQQKKRKREEHETIRKRPQIVRNGADDAAGSSSDVDDEFVPGFHCDWVVVSDVIRCVRLHFTVIWICLADTEYD